MINKENNNNKVIKAKEVAEKYGLTNMVMELDAFIFMNNNYKVHILMIGEYSAGKSALLNKYIGKNILKENQQPETDIATELYFSENEKIIANLLNGEKKEISSLKNIDIDTTKNIEYYINSGNINEQSDYILVDTPGFDSGIEKHNKALMQYIDYKTAFIVAIDCEKGTISESVLKFINEISNYSMDIAIIINKCDKKIEEEVQKVKEHIENLLLTSTGRNFPIICTSIYDNDVENKIKEVIRTFNPQYLYDKHITSELNKKCNLIIEALEIIKSNEACDVTEIEEEILKRENAKKKLLEQLDLQKKKLDNKIHNEVKEHILSIIYSQLISNTEILAEASKGGVEMLQEKVVEIIRPIMISEVEEYSSIAYEDFLKNLNYSSLNIYDNSDELKVVVESVYEKLKNLTPDNSSVLPIVDESKKDKLIKNSLNTYRIVGSALAITTSVVSPPLELLIVFLPDIIKAIKVLTGTTKEQQLIEAIQNKIIPQIIKKLRNELDNSLSKVETVMIDNISTNIQEILDIENNALEIALIKKEKVETDYINFIASIEQDIEKIRG